MRNFRDHIKHNLSVMYNHNSEYIDQDTQIEAVFTVSFADGNFICEHSFFAVDISQASHTDDLEKDLINWFVDDFVSVDSTKVLFG